MSEQGLTALKLDAYSKIKDVQTDTTMKLSYQDDASQLLIDEIRKLKDDLTNYMQSSSIQISDIKTTTETEIGISSQKVNDLVK